jgi:predicted small secreted protein
MSRLRTTLTWTRDHALWLALLALPMLLAACNNSGTGSGY